VSSTLSALARKAARDKKHRFGSLYRLIDLQMLYESFRSLFRSNPGAAGHFERQDYRAQGRGRAALALVIAAVTDMGGIPRPRC
jgi:hypothetical protein